MKYIAVIKKLEDYIQKFAFNTAISSFMICVNELKKLNCRNLSVIKELTQLMAPFAPFVTAEIWSNIGMKDSIHKSIFPKFNEEYLKETSIEYPLSINGKKRDTLIMPADASKKDIEEAALNSEIVKKWIDGHPIKKIIVVPGRMINIVV